MILLYGTGIVGKRCLKYFIESKIDTIIITDSNENLWGSDIFGLKVLPLPVALNNVDRLDTIIICTDIYFFDIYTDLVRAHKIPLAKIISWREVDKKKGSYLTPLFTYIKDGLSENKYSIVLNAGVMDDIFLSRSSISDKTTIISIRPGCFPLLNHLYDTNNYTNNMQADLILCTEENFEELLSISPFLYKSEWWIKTSTNFNISKIEKIWTKDRISMIRFPCNCLMVIRKEIDLNDKRYTIYVASHINFNIKHDHLYQPLYIGHICSQKKANIETVGININELNPFINEYTAIYWIWKNSNADIVGMNHYRRYFYNDSRIILGNELNINRVDEIMKEYDLILPRPEILNTMVKENIIRIIGEPLYEQISSLIFELMDQKYYRAFLHVHNGNIFYSKAMFVTRKEILDQYCTWVFPILFEVLNRVDMNKYTGNMRRAVGYFAETMWTVWLLNTEYKIKELWIDHI